MRSILVTGGAGYIGSHVCKALAQAGFQPVTYDSLIYGHEWAVNWGPLEVGELSDGDRLDQVMRKYGPEGIIHLAAFAYVGESVSNPLKYYKNNVGGTISLVESAHRNGVKKFVFSSTCATYGVPKNVPIVESEPPHPVNPYGASKLMVERVLADCAVAYGLEWCALRYFNAAGADPACRIGESHDPETHLIPLIIDVAKGVRPHITIFGNDYDTPDGTCIRDYIHVDDLADAHVRALERLGSSLPTIINLGTGRGYSVLEVIDSVQAVTNNPILVEVGARRAGDPARLVSDPSLALDALGWKAQYVEIGPIVDTAWRWHCRESPA
ncbi:UDP-glucose 4-epimerase [Candidatus Phaeomarinobacter ectocarpi]|uniref:UDP-glucose 4-epimerase n=2 Tax=Candidatus Phaeomarinibacter ectocarpi TaxID=1458461 RepID=X5MMA0_9HYPH|nr:UDP-glucose 4-epimerase [Candidatus Phaeomarinobacter ectocarpi]